MWSNREPRGSLLSRQRDPYTRRSPFGTILGSINWEIVAGFLIILGVAGYFLSSAQTNLHGVATFVFVMVGWVFSLCLHEFAHAATAYLSGDHSDGTVRYLSFNPLHYLHPVLSILLPLVILLLGGIGLPGGAVYLRRDLVRGRLRQSAISAAGPAMNLLIGLLLGLAFRLNIIQAHTYLGGAFAWLALLQFLAVIINLVPVPGLDGFGILEPFLPESVRVAAHTLGNYGFLILFVLFVYYQPAGAALFRGAFSLLDLAGIPFIYASLGQGQFFFWRG